MQPPFLHVTLQLSAESHWILSAQAFPEHATSHVPVPHLTLLAHDPSPVQAMVQSLPHVMVSSQLSLPEHAIVHESALLQSILPVHEPSAEQSMEQLPPAGQVQVPLPLHVSTVHVSVCTHAPLLQVSVVQLTLSSQSLAPPA